MACTLVRRRGKHASHGKVEVFLEFVQGGVLELANELAEVRKVLHIDPNEPEFRVVFGATSSSPKTLPYCHVPSLVS
jgi:hypothetical protein